MSEHAERPRPHPDTDNREFLADWQAGRLVVQACGDCGQSFFYPRPLCPHCWSDRLEWRELPGDGEVVSFSLIYRPNHSAFLGEVPIVLAEIRVAAGVTMLARVVGVAPVKLRTGLPVRVVRSSQAARYTLPTFEPGAERGSHDD
jgi:uncharacterized protein